MPDLLCMGEPMLEFNQLPPDAEGRVLYLEGHGGDTSNAAIAAARQATRATPEFNGFLASLTENPIDTRIQSGIAAGGRRVTPLN